MIHDTYFLGMHLIWWAVWFILLAGLILWRYNTSGSKKKVQLDLLEKRFTSGDISSAEYLMRKATFADTVPFDSVQPRHFVAFNSKTSKHVLR